MEVKHTGNETDNIRYGDEMREQLPISVCMIAKNEERYIEECLQRIRMYPFEIVLVDTGSTDRTIEIAGKYVDKLEHFNWCDDFSKARNYAISCATRPWIFILDCDEMVEYIECDAMLSIMKEHREHVGMLPIKNVNIQDGIEHYHIDKVPRFFHKDFFHYAFPIHEQVVPVGAQTEEVVLSTYELPIQVRHLGYNLSPEEMIQKQQRNLRILQKAIGQYNYDDYLYFQIGQSCAALGKYEEAAEAFRKCFEKKPDKRKGFYNRAVCSYARVLLILDRCEEGIDFVQQFGKEVQEPELIQTTGILYEKLAQYPLALVSWMKLVHSKNREVIGEKAIYDAYVRAIQLQRHLGVEALANQFQMELDTYKSEHRGIRNV